MKCVTAGNIMVQLFVQTQPKYHLTNKKLQYLLCIAQMMSLAAGRVLFPENIRNLKNDFALEPIADTFIYSRAIQEGKETNRVLEYTYDDFVIPYSGKKIYETKEPISEEDKQVLIDTFIQFGAYDEGHLCKELDALKPLRQLPIWSYIASETVAEFLEAALSINSEYSDSRIISLCQEIHLNSAPQAQADREEVSSPVQAAPANVALDAAPAVVVPVPVIRNVLKGYGSYHLDCLVAGKGYSLYIETSSEKVMPVVKVISLNDNSLVPGVLAKVTDTVYRYSFLGVASDTKIVLDI